MGYRETTVGIASEYKEVLGLGANQVRVLRQLWEAGEPQTVNQVFQTIFLQSVEKGEKFPAAQTVNAALYRMQRMGLIKNERPTTTGPCLYEPTQNQHDVTLAIMGHAWQHLIGKPLPPELIKAIEEAMSG